MERSQIRAVLIAGIAAIKNLLDDRILPKSKSSGGLNGVRVLWHHLKALSFGFACRANFWELALLAHFFVGHRNY